MEKIITISVKKNGAIKYDLGKNSQSVFVLIDILTLCIRNIAQNGYKQEEEKHGK